MKKQLTTCIFLALSILSIGQNAKIKTNTIIYKFDIYPEFGGYEDYKTFDMKISDKSGNTYSYSEENTAEARSKDINNQAGFGFSLKHLSGKNDFYIDVLQNSSVQNTKELKIYEDQTTKINRIAYKITANQSYTVKIYDAKKGNTLIHEFTESNLFETYWPGIPSSTVGYLTEKELAREFLKKQELEEGFYKKIESKLIQDAIISKISKTIYPLFYETFAKEVFLSSYVKTKDPKFEKLDSAAIYLEQGFEAIKINNKALIKGNHHINNALSLFKKAHSIYLEFNKPEYLNWFENQEVKNEYKYGMKANLYFTYFLISDFTNTNLIYDELKLIVENEKSNNKDNSPLSLLNRSASEKSFDAISIFRPYQIREEKFFTTYQERYKY